MLGVVQWERLEDCGLGATQSRSAGAVLLLSDSPSLTSNHPSEIPSQGPEYLLSTYTQSLGYSLWETTLPSCFLTTRQVLPTVWRRLWKLAPVWNTKQAQCNKPEATNQLCCPSTLSYHGIGRMH